MPPPAVSAGSGRVDASGADRGGELSSDTAAAGGGGETAGTERSGGGGGSSSAGGRSGIRSDAPREVSVARLVGIDLFAMQK